MVFGAFGLGVHLQVGFAELLESLAEIILHLR
jgi:hypothetical protein